MDKVGIALLAIVGMLAWICLWGWMALADWSSPSRLLAQRWKIAIRRGHAAYKFLRHFWHPEYIVTGLAAALVLLGIYFFNQGMYGTSKFATTFAPNFAADCFSLAATQRLSS